MKLKTPLWSKEYLSQLCEKFISYIDERCSRNVLPTIAGFCAQQKIFKKHFLAYLDEDKSEALAYAYDYFSNMQEDLLITKALNETFNPTFSIFAAKNLIGWKNENEGLSDKTTVVVIKNVISQNGVGHNGDTGNRLGMVDEAINGA